MLADRLADALITQDPNANTYWKHSGSTHVMSGPTFLNRHPELAEKYGITGEGQRLLVKEGKPTSLDSKVMNQIPIDEVAMELKGQRIPVHTKKPQSKNEPDIQYVAGYDRIVARINPGNIDDSKYGGNRFTDVTFYELNSTTGKKTEIGNYKDDFQTASGQPNVDLTSSTGEPIKGPIDEIMDSLYRANPQNVFSYNQQNTTTNTPTPIRGETIDKNTGMPMQYKKGGYVNKYGNGGDVIDLSGYASASAEAGSYTWDAASTSDYVTSASSTGDVALTGMQEASMYASYAKAALDVGMGIKEGIEGTKAFYEDADDSLYYDKEAAEKQLKEARAQKYGAGAEAAGFTAGTIIGTALTGNPATGATIGKITGDVFEFVGENVSKLFGVGKKAKSHMEKQLGQHLDYVHGERMDALAIKERKEQEKKLSNYLMEISNPGQKMYAELGGMLYGPSHSQGGIPIEAEGGEFIIRKDAIANDAVRTYTGTNKQIAEQINKNIYG